MGCVAVKTQTRKVGGGAVCREDRRRSTTLRHHLEATERSLLLREPRGLCCCCCYHSSLRLLQDSTVQQQQPRHHSTSRAPAFHGPFCSESSLSEKGPAQSASQLLARPRAPSSVHACLPSFVARGRTEEHCTGGGCLMMSLCRSIQKQLSRCCPCSSFPSLFYVQQLVSVLQPGGSFF
jgi:hypothetical protein